jgi:hypothetical protein
MLWYYLIKYRESPRWYACCRRRIWQFVLWISFLITVLIISKLVFTMTWPHVIDNGESNISSWTKMVLLGLVHSLEHSSGLGALEQWATNHRDPLPTSAARDASWRRASGDNSTKYLQRPITEKLTIDPKANRASNQKIFSLIEMPSTSHLTLKTERLLGMCCKTIT